VTDGINGSTVLSQELDTPLQGAVVSNIERMYLRVRMNMHPDLAVVPWYTKCMYEVYITKA
jgi:hypothetical protein